MSASDEAHCFEELAKQEKEIEELHAECIRIKAHNEALRQHVKVWEDIAKKNQENCDKLLTQYHDIRDELVREQRQLAMLQESYNTKCHWLEQARGLLQDVVDDLLDRTALDWTHWKNLAQTWLASYTKLLSPVYKDRPKAGFKEGK